MISKRRLKERLLDICAGAGYTWEEADEYFEGGLGELGKVIQAIEWQFDLPGSGALGKTTRVRSPWRLKDYEHIDTMVDLVYEAIEYDKDKE